jgi:hypothetical protein
MVAQLMLHVGDLHYARHLCDSNQYDLSDSHRTATDNRTESSPFISVIYVSLNDYNFSCSVWV